PRRYASMNLVWAGARGVSIAYARREGTLEIERLPRGIHVLCNDRLGAPGFPRADRLRGAIAEARSRGVGAPAAPPARRGASPVGSIERADLAWPAVVPALEAALADHTRVDPPPSHLPADVARELTATCIHTAAYGTRSSTIFAAERGRTIAYRHADGPPCTTRFVDRIALL